MSSAEKKNNFEWEKGHVLDEKNISPVPEVRAKGLPKIAKAVHADPSKRKEERDKKILNIQSKPYQLPSKDELEDDVILEESQSGLSADIEKSDAERLLDSGKKFRGLDRFSDKKKEKE